ncbi:tetratricopeptide repeat protein, partial [Oceanicella sp. SM1341]|uniref:tetratricopeptide repeat protein n=1 Tax=Oceanicella sp. SM1341 TaxID=1548889 RepID=UPI001E5FAFD5
ALRAAGRAQDAREMLDALPPAPAAATPVRLLAAALALEANDPDTAEAGYAAVLAERPDHAEALLGRIDCALARDDLAASATRAGQAAALRPDDERITRRHAAVLRRQGRARAAALLLVRALRRAPANLQLRTLLAECHAELGRDACARRHFRRVAARRPAHLAARLGLAELALRRDDRESFRRHLEAAEAAHPDSRQLGQRKAQLLVRAGQSVEALTVVRALLDQAPDDPGPLMLCARLCRELGDTRAARDCTARAAALPGLVAFNHLSMVETALRDGDTPEALQCLARGMRAFPDSLKLRLAGVRVMRRAGRPGEAARALRTLVSRHAEVPEVQAELGGFWIEQGRPDRALRGLGRALALRPDDPGLRARRLRAALRCDGEGPEGPIVSAEIAALLGRAVPVAAEVPALRCLVTEGALLLPPAVLGRLRARLAGLAPLLPEEGANELLRAADAAADAGAARAALARLFDCGPVSLASCRHLLTRFRGLASDAEFRRLGAHLMCTAPPGLRAELEAEIARLDTGPAEALRRCRAHRRPQRSLRQAILLLRLLNTAGARALARRYGRACLRRWPGELPLLEAQFEVLNLQGREAEMAELLAAARPSGRRARTVHLRLRARLLGEMFRPGEALELLARADRLDPEGPRNALGLDLMLAAGRLEDARARTAQMQLSADAPGLNIRHLGTTLSGTLLNDLTLCTLEEAEPDPPSRAELAGRYVAAAKQELGRWLAGTPAGGACSGTDAPRGDGARAGAGGGEARDTARAERGRCGGPSLVPRRVLQYWNSPEVPGPVAGVMASWQEARAAGHALWDRAAALSWLAARFGPDHVLAFRRAHHVAEEADFLRLCLLFSEGGLYADADDRLACPGIFDLLPRGAGLVCFREHRGALSNNVIVARPGHPVIGRAAEMAREALLARDNDCAWTKTGPGVLTRAAAECLLTLGEAAMHDVVILPVGRLREMVQIHVPLPYKKTERYWDARSRNTSRALRRLLLDTLRRADAPAEEAAAPG